MRVVTYNVNSIRPRLPRIVALLEVYEPDILCVQETKASEESFPHDELAVAGYRAADFSAGQWAGVAVIARHGLDITDVVRGLPGEREPGQARWIEATVEGIKVVSAYVPNGRTVDSPEYASKLQFLDAMTRRAGELAAESAIVAGDMNVCPTDLDVWDPAAVHGGTHVTPAERARIGDIVGAGFVDAFRALEPTEPGFTWWDYRAGHFHKGFGLRIDLALVSPSLARRLTAARVDRDFRKPTRVPESKPSDHAPLIVDF
jgi:exodeoxyribonuclease III